MSAFVFRAETDLNKMAAVDTMETNPAVAPEPTKVKELRAFSWYFDIGTASTLTFGSMTALGTLLSVCWLAACSVCLLICWSD